MPSQSLVVTLECAGNGRTLFDPPVEGEKWRQGAVSTAEWTGVPLVEVMDRAGLDSAGRELVFRGADGGPLDGLDNVRFERSLPVDIARDPNVLLAYAMNGEPLPRQHGYPLRLVVPSWYAVASVKWLQEIEVIDDAFAGAFQTERYYFEHERDGRVTREPVSLQRVRSLITEPDDGSSIDPGPVAIRGVAWSGAAEIAGVAVSIDGGAWQEARIIGQRKRHGWQWWELLTRIEHSGSVTIRSRATDMAGRTQPEQAEWNRLGYGNNSITGVTVVVA
jgi:DMSO/TMAO reductase YedYZ molybdopterin-dependent catalytic subunit